MGVKDVRIDTLVRGSTFQFSSDGSRGMVSAVVRPGTPGARVMGIRTVTDPLIQIRGSGRFDVNPSLPDFMVELL